MHTEQNDATEKLDFVCYIKKFYPNYIVDGNNVKTLTNLGLWAMRDEKFNNIQSGWHIDRGLLLFGRPGVGKDEMMRLLRRYISYLRSPYGFTSKVVWQLAASFAKEGYSCIHEGNGNIYYEELALTDERSGELTREIVSHYGNKLLLGAEIIHIRNDVFKKTAQQTHFSTNLNIDQLEKVYGYRVISRLNEMCNFVMVTGSDRRGKGAPEFLNNKMEPKVVAARETTVQEHEENKKSLEEHYQDFLADKHPSTSLAFVYNLLVSYNVNVATEEELQRLWDIASENTTSGDVSLSRATPSEREAAQRVRVWEETKKSAVVIFFNRLRDAGSKTIFGERSAAEDIKNIEGDIRREDIK